MSFKVTLVGAQAHESTPQVALYALDNRGRVAAKIGVVADGQLSISRDHGDIVALGPDVESPATLDPKGFVTLHLADQLPVWEKTGEILIPAPWWRGWLGFTICLTGNAYRCFPIFRDQLALRAQALGQQRIIFPEQCVPLCNAIVEVWESRTCCWPFLLSEVPKVIANLSQFLAENPIMFPIPRPGPGPVETDLAQRVSAALGAGKVAQNFAPSTTLGQHLLTLQSLSQQDAATYIEANPDLWRFWCNTESFQLGQTVLNPDGSFSYCYHYFPFFLFDCRNSYFYIVKQLVDGVWTTIYDGAAANQYFTADQVANLYTQTGTTCFQPPPINGNDYVALQAIGSTDTWNLNSAWNGALAGIDQTQTGDLTLANPPADGGLLLGNGAPWATTLSFLLAIDPDLQGTAAYYRMSIVQADMNGQPLAGATRVTLKTPISWQYFDTSTNPVTIASQALGPVTLSPGGNVTDGLYSIPYPGGSNPNWLGGQAYQVLDTTTLQNIISSGPGNGNGRFLLALEVFDASGNRLIPQAATATGPTDTPTALNFIRLLSSTTTANVDFASLTHLIWVDNRPCVAAIEYFQSPFGTQDCQFLKADPSSLFYVGYQAYHAVMCDGPASPVPTRTFMNSFEMTWQEGLSGTSGTLVSGGDTNQSIGCTVAVANAVTTPGTSFGTLLGTETACAFAIVLGAYPKHTNGSGIIWGYEAITDAAVALSI